MLNLIILFYSFFVFMLDIYKNLGLNFFLQYHLILLLKNIKSLKIFLKNSLLGLGNSFSLL